MRTDIDFSTDVGGLIESPEGEPGDENEYRIGAGEEGVSRKGVDGVGSPYSRHVSARGLEERVAQPIEARREQLWTTSTWTPARLPARLSAPPARLPTSK